VPALLAFSAFAGKQAQYLLPQTAAFALLVGTALAARDRAGTAPPIADRLVVAGVLFLLAVAIVGLAGQPRFANLIQSGERPAIALTIVAIDVIVVVLALLRAPSHVASAAMIGTASVLVLLAGYAGLGRALFDSYDVRPVARHLSRVEAAGRPIAHFGRYHGQYQFVGRLRQPLRILMSTQETLAWTEANPDGAVIVYSYRPLTSRSAQPEFRQGFKGREVYVWRAADLRNVADGSFTSKPAELGGDEN
jgi:4-amino-4-deoxy-L-arabinose transferase-like glycosyltransferase